MARLWLRCTIMTALVVVAFSAHAATVGIAAVVGEDVITTSDVSERRDLLMATAGIPTTPENQKKITPRIIQSLIDETLQMQEAKRQSLTVTDEELARAIAAMQSHGERKETVQDFVKSRGLSLRSLEAQVRAQLAWSKVVQRKLRRNVSISTDEVHRAQLAAAAAPGEADLRIQALEFSMADATKQSAISKVVEDVALELKSGTDMATVAARYVREPGVRYSQPSWVPESQLPPLLQQSLRAIPDGQVTPPLRSGNVVQLLQVMERRTAPKSDDATEYALKQIAISIPKKRDKAAMTSLREAASMLRSNPGDCMSETEPMVALPVAVNFVRARNNALSPQQRGIVAHLDIGQVSEPLMGPDALRLVMMCEKIEPSTGALPDAEKIRQQLFAEKVELEAQKHLRNLRRDAYIDIKDAQ